MSELPAIEAMDEAQLLSLFESCQLPRRMWNHRAHITVAYLYLQQYPLDEAITRLREGIQHYNAVAGQGVGYHETVTQTWVRIIHAVIQNHGAADCARHFFDRHAYLLDKTLPLLFFSDHRIMAREARNTFIPPDLLALPIPIEQGAENDNFERDAVDVPIPRDPYAVICQTSTVINGDPANYNAYCLRAQMRLRRGELDAALADLNRAISLAPENAETNFWLATTHAARQEEQAAVKHLKKALELGYQWFGFVYKFDGWRTLRTQPEVAELLQQYADKYDMTL